VVLLVCGVAGVAVWATVIFFSWRWIRLNNQADYDKKLLSWIEAAPWSDHHLVGLLEQNPRHPRLLNHYLDIAVRREDWPEALRRAELCIESAPRSPRGWVARYGALHHLGRDEEALAVLRQALHRLPRDTEVATVWANEARGRGDWPEAVRRFATLRRLAPQRVDGYEAGAIALVEDGRAAEAEALISEGLERIGENWLLWQAAARLAGRLGKQEEAIGWWEAMRAKFPSESAGFLHGAEALARAGRAEEAADLIRRAHDFFPGNKEIAAAVTHLAPGRALTQEG
jgi:predicted Zn-dependent protease